MEASQGDWLGGRQFDVDRYLHGATLEETVAPGVYYLVTGKRRDSNVYVVQSGETWVLVDTMWRGRAELIRGAAETLFGVGARPRAIVLTHVHPDHAGSASELAHMWDDASEADTARQVLSPGAGAVQFALDQGPGQALDEEALG